MDVAYKPYTFARVPRATRAQVNLQQTALDAFGQPVLKDDFAPGLQAMLRKLLGVGCSWGAADVRVVSAAEVGGLLAPLGYFAVVGAAPGPHKVLVDLDPSLGAWCVERLLGGREAAVPARMLRAPTELELGVCSYVFLQLLTAFDHGLLGGKEWALRLERLVGSSEALQAAMGEATDYVGVGLRVQLGERLGYVRILLPQACITRHFGARLASTPDSPQALAHMRRCLAALPERTVVLRVIGAQLTLDPDDIANVEAGDIIVLENHALTRTDAGVRGDVRLVVGSGRHGRIDAKLIDALGESKLQIVDIAVQEQLEEPSMDDAPATPEPQDNLPQTAGLLREVDAAVAVELGRIRLNTAQLVRLRSGQVLRLARGATDPVDLVVGGKLFARGELIEVDGELGVRLTQVTGES